MFKQKLVSIEPESENFQNMKVLDLFVSYNFREEIISKFVLDFKLWIFKQKPCSEQNLMHWIF